MIKNRVKERPRAENGSFLPQLENVANSGVEKEITVARKEASNKFKVSEWKVRIVQEIEKTAPKVYEKLSSGDLQIHEARFIWGLMDRQFRSRYLVRFNARKICDIIDLNQGISLREGKQNRKFLPFREIIEYLNLLKKNMLIYSILRIIEFKR